MVYKCLRCQHHDYRGCMPTVSCGMFLSAIALIPAFAFQVVALGARRVWFPHAGGWYDGLVVPASLFVGILGILPTYGLLAGLEWLLFALRRCPECHARRWSFGFTQGYGL